MPQNFWKKGKEKRVSLAVAERGERESISLSLKGKRKKRISLVVAEEERKINLAVVKGGKKGIQLIYSYFIHCKKIVKVIRVVIAIQ